MYDCCWCTNNHVLTPSQPPNSPPAGARSDESTGDAVLTEAFRPSIYGASTSVMQRCSTTLPSTVTTTYTRLFSSVMVVTWEECVVMVAWPLTTHAPAGSVDLWMVP